MNRRKFFKALGLIAGSALVAPEALLKLLEPKPADTLILQSFRQTLALNLANGLQTNEINKFLMPSLQVQRKNFIEKVFLATMKVSG